MDSEDKIIPFSIFISTYRRKKILDAMMGKTPKEKEDGARILNNYKKQLAEKMARERTEKGESLSNTAHSFKKSIASSKQSKINAKTSKDAKRRDGRQEGASAEVLEPEILLRILFGKGTQIQSPSLMSSKK